MIGSQSAAPRGGGRKHSEKAGQAGPESTGEGETPGGTETILLVENDAAVRVAIRRLLERLGYHVLEAQSAQGAVDFGAVHRGVIHLLMTDVIMPEMTGGQIASRLRTLRPELRVLYMSGHDDATVSPHVVRAPHAAFLAKPFTMAVLARKVREVLGTA
jgi:CheY-like chemotaxis protein